ncbi:MAG: hypothetical protein KIS77_02105 [Saprospiraceae bacterium]|nr:hypothetical protein [Saprospiraceae bacterium]
MTIGKHIHERILLFLNHAKSAEDIINPNVVQDHQGNGYTIGREVAQRLLDKRDKLPGKRFGSINQVLSVAGFGTDKLKDLAHSVAIPAAKHFRGKMYEHVILENWELEHHTVRFDNRKSFLEIAQNIAHLTTWVGMQVELMAAHKLGSPKAARLANLLLQKSQPEFFPDAHYGSFAFALWFYQFDADNWFGFEKVRLVIEEYLTYYTSHAHRLEFCLFRGFENEGVLVNAVTRPDLPVVLNHGEQEISIWTAQLND